MVAGIAAALERQRGRSRRALNALAARLLTAELLADGDRLARPVTSGDRPQREASWSMSLNSLAGAPFMGTQ